jgi:hypothetical protein
VGDTFAVTNTGSSVNCLLSQTNSILGGVTTPLTPGSSITVTMASAGATVLSVGTGGSNFVNVNVTISAAPTPSSADDAPVPAWYLQEVPMPASGVCSDVQDVALSWGTDVTGGWTRAWGDWANTWVCSRALTDAGGTWNVAGT